MSEYDSTDALVSIDFSSRFPHKYWVSSWSHDDQYPNGFRYQLLSVRPEPSGHIERLHLHAVAREPDIALAELPFTVIRPA